MFNNEKSEGHITLKRKLSIYQIERERKRKGERKGERKRDKGREIERLRERGRKRMRIGRELRGFLGRHFAIRLH